MGPEPTDSWGDAGLLSAEQERGGRLRPESWRPDPSPLVVAAAFVAFAPGEAGPGHAGDRAWVGAVAVREGMVTGSRTAPPVPGVVVRGHAGGRYVPGLLAVREGAMTVKALAALEARVGRPDVVMLDATGRDHPRRCGLAVHVGWVLDVPTIGVTHRLLTDRDRPVPALDRRGQAEPINIDGEAVAAWVCTADGARPVVVHAGWRTDVGVAVEVALRTSDVVRTPEPLREARRLAREARSMAGGGWDGYGPAL